MISLSGIKFKTAFSLLIVLSLSMSLTTFVFLTAVQRELVEYQISRGHKIVDLIQSELGEGISLSDLTSVSCYLRTTDPVDFILLIGNDAICSSNEMSFDLNQVMTKKSAMAISSAERSVSYYGDTWGVLWKQKKYLIISSSLARGRDDSRIGLSIALNLENTYSLLRSVLSIVSLYLLLNLAAFLLLGIYRLHGIAIKPLNSLLTQAENHLESDYYFSLSDKTDNEFTKLSKSLNRMLQTIADDKQKLKEMVSSLENANLELKQAQRKLIGTEKLASVGRLASCIAHEIGNPLSIILGFLDLLKNDYLTKEEKAEFISRSEAEVNRISSIIRQLLDLSRSGSSAKSYVNIHDILKDVSDMFKVKSSSARFTISLHLSAEKSDIFSDPAQLRQVFLNLILNAYDAVSTFHDGQLLIKTESIADSPIGEIGGSFIGIAFMDNGIGIPRNQLQHIFDPFFTTKEKGKGTGLGLYVSHMIIEKLGGRISVVSEPNKGSTFTIYLPITDR